MSDPPHGNHSPGSDFGPPDENANGLHAFMVLRQFLEEHNWNPQQLTDRYIYRLLFQGKNGSLHIYAQVRIEAEQLVIYAMSPLKFPEEARPALAEYLSRANYGLYIGNFELDFNDGEVRFKSSLDFEDVPLPPDLIRNTMYPALHMMDKYLPGMMRVAYSGVAPAEAIQEIEG